MKEKNTIFSTAWWARWWVTVLWGTIAGLSAFGSVYAAIALDVYAPNGLTIWLALSLSFFVLAWNEAENEGYDTRLDIWGMECESPARHSEAVPADD